MRIEYLTAHVSQTADIIATKSLRKTIFINGHYKMKLSLKSLCVLP